MKETNCYNCKYGSTDSAVYLKTTIILSLGNNIVGATQIGCTKPSVSNIIITNGKMQCSDFEPKN